MHWEKPFHVALHDKVDKNGAHTKGLYIDGTIGTSGISITAGIAKVFNIPAGPLLMKFQGPEVSGTLKLFGKEAGAGVNGDIFFSGAGPNIGGTASYAGLKVGMGAQVTEQKASLGAIVGTSTEEVK